MSLGKIFPYILSVIFVISDDEAWSDSENERKNYSLDKTNKKSTETNNNKDKAVTIKNSELQLTDEVCNSVSFKRKNCFTLLVIMIILKDWIRSSTIFFRVCVCNWICPLVI